jgi:dephospho-CoA kinase
MSVQVPTSKLKKCADIIIHNNGTVEQLMAKATALATTFRD